MCGFQACWKGSCACGKTGAKEINKVNKPAAAGSFPGAAGLLSQYEKKKPFIRTASSLESGGDLLFRAVSSQVPSALKGLTSVFGMGTGGTPSPLPPEIVAFVGPRSVRFRSLIILAQGTVSSSLGVFLSLEAFASAFRAAHPTRLYPAIHQV